MNDLEKMLLNDFQRDFPLSVTPFADIAARVGAREAEVIDALAGLQSAGSVSRIGAVFHAGRIGASSLAAMSVPEERLQEVASLVNSYPETSHNYEREHDFNLWFVLSAASEERLQQVLDEIEHKSGLNILFLPMLEDYHIDLGFDLQWTS